MPNFLQALIPLLSSTIAIILALGPAPARGQGDATSFSYDFIWWDPPTGVTYQGDARYPIDTSMLRLTRTDPYGASLPNSAGRVVHAAPVKMWDTGAKIDFETTVKFMIFPNPVDTNPGDGLVFFVAPVGLPLGSIGASFGVFDATGRKPSVFAVEFDIYPNPGVDPASRHIGIDIESNVSKNTTNVGADFFFQEREVTAVIKYKQETKLITVRASAGGSSFEVSYVFDLSSILPKQVQVGISASTGNHVADHEVVSWSFDTTVASSSGGIREYV